MALAETNSGLTLSKEYDGEADISNIGFIPGTMLMAVLERSRGRLMVVPLEGGDPWPLLDIRTRLKSPIISEQGLLGVAFQYDFQTSHTLYLVYTNRFNQWTLSRFKLSDPPAPTNYDEEVLLRADRYAPHHPCGQIEFHPIDGYLYACLGDSDAQGAPNETSVNLEILHGKIIRIDVASADTRYVIPPDNPYRQNASARPEIWVSGLRNPWQFSFDPRTGDAFIPDVGWSTVEEINFREFSDGAATNFGWPEYEGELPVRSNRRPCDSSACAEPPFTFPVYSYKHDNGCAVIGGATYRGNAFPRFDGTYFFTDFCSQYLYGLRCGTRCWEVSKLGLLPFQPRFIKSGPRGVIYIGGADGEVWSLDLSSIGTVNWQIAAQHSHRSMSELDIQNLGDLARLIATEPARTVVISVKDEATRAVSQQTMEALSAVGLDFSHVQYRGSFAAVVKGGRPIAQEVNNSGSVTLESDDLRALGIDRVYSAGFEVGNSSQIVIDGTDLSPNVRGFNLAIINGDNVQVGAIDTYETELVSPPPSP